MRVSVSRSLHLPAFMSRAHGLPFNSPRALLISTMTYGAFVSLHLSTSWDDSGFCKAVWTVFADRAALIRLIHGVHTFRLGTRRHCAQHFTIGFTATPFTWRHHELLQSLVGLAPELAVVLPLFALRTALTGVNVDAARVKPRALWLGAKGPLLRTQTWAG